MRRYLVLAAVVITFWSLSGVAAEEAATPVQPHEKGLADSPVKASSVAEARRQAELLHNSLHAALQIMHHRYYIEDEGLLLPAAAMKEVFADVQRESNVALRWLVVEGQAMNTDHEAQTAFEQEAARAIRDGKPSHEMAADGLYRRAAPILLTAHCLKCHVPNRTTTKTHKAGLVITVPLEKQ